MRKIEKRAAESKVYKKYQLLGLEIAKILEDQKHKTLYIKFAKEKDADSLLRLAKEISEKLGVKNKGAYFMSVVHSNEKKDKNKDG